MVLFRWLAGAVFVASLAVTAWWYAGPLGQPAAFRGWRPIAVDAALFLLFALHHSALARPSLKAMMARFVPETLVRSVYVWTASLLLIAVVVFWQRVGGVAFHITGRFAIVNAAVQLAGLLLIALAVRIIDPLELAGIRQPAGGQTLQIRGLYRFVRHPLYLGWVLALFGAARMTGDRLTFAVISCVYLAIAVIWEEQALEREFGQAYARYKQQVRWRVVPYLY